VAGTAGQPSFCCAGRLGVVCMCFVVFIIHEVSDTV
jgi:hypothetical protein